MRVSRIKTFFLIASAVACQLLAFVHPLRAEEPKPGDARIARWRDDRTAAFLLMFDDSWPSHWQVAGPELAKRGLTATFYICPGKGEYKKFAQQWEETLWKQGMVYGNHTMTHKGVKDFDDADREIGDCAKEIRRITGAKVDRLVSFALPGVGPNDWNITKAQQEQLLKKHHLVDRPPFNDHGAVYALKTKDEMLALANKAIANQGMEYLVIHGVERIKPDWGYQDFWSLKQDILLPLLDELKAKSDKGELWITDHISMHQYETERNTAEVKVLESTASIIRLELKCKADPKAYDLPLTLVTRVPADWKQVGVKQGDKTVAVAAKDGLVRFDATPGDAVIVLTPAKDR